MEALSVVGTIHPVKKFLSNLVLFFFTLSIAFSICEAAFRFLGYPAAIYDYDPETGLGLLIAGNDFNYVKDCLKSRVTTNAAGFHDREFSRGKSEGTYRIAVIGDSFVQALEVPLEKTFPKRLEAKLNASGAFGGRSEVYAFGRSGNGSALNYLYLKRIAASYRPDLIIHAFYPLNDPRDDSPALTDKYVRETGDAEVRLGKVYPILGEDGRLDAARLEADLDAQNRARAPRPFWVAFARRSSFVTWLKERFKMAVYNLGGFSHGRMEEGSAGAQELPVDQEVFLKRQSPDWDAAWAVEEKLIEAMAGEARAIGADYLLVSLADGLRVEGQYREFESWDDSAVDLDAPEKRLAAIAAKTGVNSLALMPAFSRNASLLPSAKTTFSCDAHWNETAHEWAADAIFKHLSRVP
jgi:hypothetical protein